MKLFLIIASLLLATPLLSHAQSTGGIRGEVRAGNDAALADVVVTASKNDSEVARALSNSKGEFEIK